MISVMFLFHHQSIITINIWVEWTSRINSCITTIASIKPKKYWKTLFDHFIDIAVVNAYILRTEKVQNPKTGKVFVWNCG